MVNIQIRIRECFNCGHEAAALEGAYTDCAKCSGHYYKQTGWKDVETSPRNADEYLEAYPDEVRKDPWQES